MLDFQNGEFLKLRAVDAHDFESLLGPCLTQGEQPLYAFRSVRDGVVFTNRRVIAINVQGVTGKKKEISSLPYRCVQSFAIETAGIGDIDGELDLWMSGGKKVRFEFAMGTKILSLCGALSEFLL